MQISSAFCRAQQADHTQRAAESRLSNVRAISTSAAAAWGIEAIAAERREKRNTRRQADADALLFLTEDRSFSENPDRGFSDQLDERERPEAFTHQPA